MIFIKFTAMPVSINLIRTGIKEIDPQELTLTFVCSRYPRNLLKHLESARGISTEYQGGGIYYLKGDPIPNAAPDRYLKLTDTENYWLQSMRTDLQAGKEIRKLMREYEKHRKSKDLCRCDGSHHPCELGTDGGGEEDCAMH